MGESWKSDLERWLAPFLKAFGHLSPAQPSAAAARTAGLEDVIHALWSFYAGGAAQDLVTHGVGLLTFMRAVVEDRRL
jgi:hypothetical protein